MCATIFDTLRGYTGEIPQLRQNRRLFFRKPTATDDMFVKMSVQTKALCKRAKTLMKYDFWLSGVNKEIQCLCALHCRFKTNPMFFQYVTYSA